MDHLTRSTVQMVVIGARIMCAEHALFYQELVSAF